MRRKVQTELTITDLMRHKAKYCKIPMNTPFVVVENGKISSAIFKITEQGVQEKINGEWVDYQSTYTLSKLDCGLAKAQAI